MKEKPMDYQKQRGKEKKQMSVILTGELIEKVDELIETLIKE